MNKNNVSSVILTILVLVALAVGVVLVRQSQELRRGAAFTTAALNLWPSERIDANVGDELVVRIKYQAATGKLVDAVQTTICYGSQVDVARVTASTDLGFDADPIVVPERSISGQTCATVVITATQSVANLKNDAEIGKIYFKAKTAGDGTITINKAQSMVTGENAGSLDKEVAISSATGTSYSIADVNVGPGPVFNYEVTFTGIRKENKCAENMTAGLIVKAGTETKVYNGTKFTRTDQVAANGFSIYTGSKVLSGFTAKTGVAAFFKGMKHLQMKYGVDKQAKMYGKEGGELVLTDLVETSKVYDFTSYPMLAGDVDQNGTVDAEDFSLIKSEYQSHATVAEGDDSAIFDLDGNCQLNTLDIAVLSESLNEKQGELY